MADISDLPVPPKKASVDISDLPSPDKKEEKPRMPSSIRGAMRRMQEPGFVPPAKQEIPSWKEIGKQYGEIGAGIPKGIVAGTPGMVGDIESLGRMVIPQSLGVEKEPFFPTSEKVGSAIFGEPESKEEAVGRTIGSIFSPNVLGKALSLGARGVIKPAQPVKEVLAKTAEKEGFILEPAQLRKDQPLPSPGFLEKAKKTNEDLATELATEKTGQKTKNIDDAFIKNREKKLGDEYDQIFGREFTIDSEVAESMKKIRNFEQSVDPAGSGDVVRSANNFIKRWEKEAEEAQRKLILQQIEKGRAPGMPTKMGQKLTSGIDSRVIRDFPNARTSGAQNLPAWFDGAEKTVNELSSQLGLKITPKIFVGTPRREGLYGLAHPDGYMVVHDGLSAENAAATVLHEFGHQAEFQLFRDAKPEVRNAVVDSFIKQRLAYPTGSKTLQQIRPITAEKYGAGAKGIPEAGYEKTYLWNFSEWFAEQTSRWITQTKTPTTVVEKFFKKIADTWKAIYEKVVGYVPMTQEVDNFFRSSWKGDLLAERASPYIPEMGKIAPEAAEFKQAIPGAWIGDITAKIDGIELQRIRSKLRNTARTNKDGAIKTQARNLIDEIDQAVAKTDPKLVEKLKETNGQWAATQTLKDGIDTGIVLGGKVDLRNLGQSLKNERWNPLYDLGRYGTQLNIVSRETGTQLPKWDTLSAILGRGRQLLGSTLGTRTQWARDVQRRGERPMTPEQRRAEARKRLTRQIPQKVGATVSGEQE